MKHRNVHQEFEPDGAVGGGGGESGIAVGAGGGGDDGFGLPLEICFIVGHFNGCPPSLPKAKYTYQ